MLGLKHRLAVVGVLIAGVVIVIGIVLLRRGRRLLVGLLCRLVRRLLVGLLRRLSRRLLVGLLRRLLLIGTRRLGRIRGGQVGRSCRILRLIGLRRLILRGLLGVVFPASSNAKRQCDGCGC